MTRWRFALVIGLVAALSITAGSPASAFTPNWTAATDLQPSYSASTGVAEVAMSADGNIAVAIWVTRVGGEDCLQSKVGTPSGASITWGATSTISTACSGGGIRSPNTFQVKLSRDGSTVVALWTQYNEGVSHDVGRAVVGKPSGGLANWGTPQDFSDVTAGDVASPQLAISSDGSRATVLYGWQTAARTERSKSATIAGTTMTWGNFTELSDPAHNTYDEHLALSSDGSRASVVWRWDGVQVAQTRSATIDGTTQDWGSRTDLNTAGGSVQSVRIAASEDGTRAIVALAQGASPFPTQAKTATISGKNATWSPSATAVSDPSVSAGDVAVAMSADGRRSTVIWRTFSHDDQTAAGTIDGLSSTWGTPVTLEGDDFGGEGPVLGMSADGARASAVWTRKIADGVGPGANDILRIYSSSATIDRTDATWTTPTELSYVPAPDQNDYTMNYPRLAVSRQDSRAVAVWMSETNGTMLDQTAYMSVAAPTISAVSPSTGTISGGTAVTVTGTGFISDAAVSIGGVTCSNIDVSSSTTLTCTTGAHSMGTVDITVTNEDAQSATLANAFRYYGGLPQSQSSSSRPSKIARSGPTVINKSDARTQQRLPMTAHVKTKLLGFRSTQRGDLACSKVKRGSRRALTLIANGRCKLQVSVTYTAPGNEVYLPYSRTYVYRGKLVS